MIFIENTKLADGTVQVQVIGELVFQAVQAVVLLLMILPLYTKKFHETEYVIVLDSPLKRSLSECVILMVCIRVGETFMQFFDDNDLG